MNWKSLEFGKLWGEKKKRLEPGKLGKKKKRERENLHIYTHSRIERYIQADTVGRRPGA